MIWNRLLSPAVLALVIPILGMLWWILSSVLEHRERMAMIANGMNPDEFKEAKTAGKAAKS